jgi:hypothetical protein
LDALLKELENPGQVVKPWKGFAGTAMEGEEFDN